jgi:hypothetical protein
MIFFIFEFFKPLIYLSKFLGILNPRNLKKLHKTTSRETFFIISYTYLNYENAIPLLLFKICILQF